MTLLAIDAGNSRVKWGLHDGVSWHARDASNNADVNELASHWKTLQPDAVIGSCVAGRDMETRIERLLPGTEITWIKPCGMACGVQNGYVSADQLGADRWAALIGAAKLLPEGGLVIGLGTAMTVDVLTPEGKFEGGIISPGLALMRTALLDATRLNPDAGQFAFPPKNTGDAIQSGAILALSGAIEKIARSMGNPRCILSGGDAATLFPHIHARAMIVDNLVLEGLLLIAREHKPK